jgi:transcriptional regulator with AAA-type ATPase domain
MPERPGLIGQAHRGILFLDEIGELPTESQAKLLRVLDTDGEYRRLGEATSRTSDFRLLAATNRDPSALKHDLLARFGVRIATPSLRERREDVPMLVRLVLIGLAQRSPQTAGRFLTKVDERTEVRSAPR